MGFSKTISAVAKEGTMPQVRISGWEEMAAERRRMVTAVVETASCYFQLTRRMTYG
jgi:hypothetical protein